MVKWIVLIMLVATNCWGALVDTSATTETQALYAQLQAAQGNYIYWGQVIYTSSDFNKAYGVSGRGNQRDETGDPVVNVLPGGTHRTEYLAELDKFASFLNSYTDSNGNLIPVLVRPFIECDGGWFWWGIDTCTEAQFIALWQDFVVYLRDTKNVHNVLYVYSPNLINGYTYDGTLYPGDGYVDIFGIDRYDETVGGSTSSLLTYYQSAYDASVSHGKVFAITEGFKNIATYADATFWTTSCIDPILADSKAKMAAYIMTWNSGWAPDSTRSDATNFISMTQNDKIRMVDYETTIRNSTIINAEIK